MNRPRFFEWIDGEKAGTVETLLNITSYDGEYFYNFDSGEACNQRFIARMTRVRGELKGKVMVEVNSPNDPWKVDTVKMGVFKTADEQYVDVPPLEDIIGATGNGQNINLSSTHLGEKKLTPPAFGGPYPELPSLDDYYVSDEEPAPVKKHPRPSIFERRKDAPSQPQASEAIAPEAPAQIPAATVEEPVAAAPVPVAAPAPAAVTKTEHPSQFSETVPSNFERQGASPIEILAKTCKKHSTDINLTISIDLPSKSMFKMVNDEFENGGEAFVNCLISRLDINEVIDSIRNSLMIAYLKDEEDDKEE